MEKWYGNIVISRTKHTIITITGKEQLYDRDFYLWLATEYNRIIHSGDVMHPCIYSGVDHLHHYIEHQLEVWNYKRAGVILTVAASLISEYIRMGCMYTPRIFVVVGVQDEI
jgi:hypothetical protein